MCIRDRGNYDRVSSMLLRGIEWKAMNLKAQDELSNRKQLNSENIDDYDSNILSRPWF